MGWTSLFLNMDKKKVFIIGTGEVASRRANRFLEKGAEVILAGNSIPRGLEEKGAILKSTKSHKNLKKWVQWADIVVIASGNEELNNYISSICDGKLLNRADYPENGNLIVPTSFSIEDVEISIFTNGKSPLMAREIRKKIQNIITSEDLLQIELQDYARNILKAKIKDQKERKKYLYAILEDTKINDLLKEKKIEEAKVYAEDLIKNEEAKVYAEDLIKNEEAKVYAEDLIKNEEAKVYAEDLIKNEEAKVYAEDLIKNEEAKVYAEDLIKNEENNVHDGELLKKEKREE
ncbi:precorrin-2 dehydrogenase [Methanobrevibacter cuticularis]|uniref:precorrin-2 dehydrogenase n=1 Tax=Methanobrevibacter cuticularis TaxID=47311 RepID=A0A166DEH0_9EURY|nr:precorrin-2 dehydrogenase [Methanobrevibacter cuticularis]